MNIKKGESSGLSPNKWHTLDDVFGPEEVREAIGYMGDLAFTTSLLEENFHDKDGDSYEEPAKEEYKKAVDYGIFLASEKITSSLWTFFNNNALILSFDLLIDNKASEYHYPAGKSSKQLTLDFTLSAAPIDITGNTFEDRMIKAKDYSYALLLRSEYSADYVFASIASARNTLFSERKPNEDYFYVVDFKTFRPFRKDQPEQVYDFISSQAERDLMKIRDANSLNIVKLSSGNLIIPAEYEKVRSLQIMMIDVETPKTTLAQLL